MTGHFVFDAFWAEAYRRAGYVVAEARPGVWTVMNPLDAIVRGKGKRP